LFILGCDGVTIKGITFGIPHFVLNFFFTTINTDP